MSEKSYADQVNDWESLLAATCRAEGAPLLLSDPDLDVEGILQEWRRTIASASRRETVIEDSRAAARAVVQEGSEQARRHSLWLQLQISLANAKLIQSGRSPYRKKREKSTP